jgi:hypothetical protein
MTIFDDLPQKLPMSRVWEGYFAVAPPAIDARAFVIIPGLSDDLVFENARWEPRFVEVVINLAEAPEPARLINFLELKMPVRGNRCLVVFDNDRAPWVVVWWPYA